jgi:hypothetical protein
MVLVNDLGQTALSMETIFVLCRIINTLQVTTKSCENRHVTDFVPSNKLPKNIDFNKHKLLRLEIVRDKGYFVESNQDIHTDNPDYTEITIPTEKLIIPEFKPLPQDISFRALVWFLRR